MDKKLVGEPFASEGKCYHVFPHIVLPLAFALGASVGLRRSLALHHYEQERFYHVLGLTKPRSLQEPDPSGPSPQTIPEDLSTLSPADKLILHLVISDWLPYVQWLVQKARPLISRYKEVDICLACPSVVAFALGMAFSRMPHITVCHWVNNQYHPVFSLAQIEQRLPFD